MDRYPGGRRRPGDAARDAGEPGETARAAAPTLPAPPETRGRPLAQQRCRCVPWDGRPPHRRPGGVRSRRRAAAPPLRPGDAARAAGDLGEADRASAPPSRPGDGTRPWTPLRRHARVTATLPWTRRTATRGRDARVEATLAWTRRSRGRDALVQPGKAARTAALPLRPGDPPVDAVATRRSRGRDALAEVTRATRVDARPRGRDALPENG